MQSPLPRNDNPNGLWRRLNRRHGAVAFSIKSAFWLALALYLVSAATHAHLYRNLEYTHYDQAAVMKLALDIRSRGNLLQTDGNRHPLFAALIAPFTSWSREGFVRAKLAGTLSGLLLLIAAFLAYGRRAGILFSIWFGLMLVLPADSGMFFSQAIPDPLYILLHGAAVLLLAQGIERPRQALVGGGLCGLAFLAKFSGLLLALFFVAFVLVRMLAFQRNDLFAFRRSLLSLSLCVAGFCFLTLPFLLQNNRQFGSPLYNANSRYFWADSWAQAKVFSAEVGDRAPGRAREREARVRASSTDLSLPGFFNRHSVGFAVLRFYNGMLINLKTWLSGRGVEFFLLLAFPVVYFFSLFGFRREEWAEGFWDPETRFLLLYFIFSFCLAGWYVAISVNLRYLYPLQTVLALMFMRALVRVNHRKPASPRVAVFCLVLIGAVTALLLAKTPLALPRGMAPFILAVQPVHPYS